MYQYEKPDNLVDFLEGSVSKYPDNPMLGTKNSSGEYEWITYREFGRRVDNARAGLAQLGVKRGDTVGLIANNRTEWAICAFATFGLGAKWVPMYEAELTQIWKYIISDSGIKVLFVSKPAIYEKVKGFPEEIKTLERMILLEGSGEGTLAWLEDLGSRNPIPSIKPDPQDVASLIYTSGTTGDPKGVLLTHGNFTSNSLGGQKYYPEFNQHDRGLSILPWAHSYAQTAELYTFVYLGASIGFMESVQTLAEDMKKVKPTFLIAVPRVFNKIYDGINARMNQEGGLKKKLFDMAVQSAKRRRELAEEGKSDPLTNIKYAIGNRLVFSKIREGFGGRLRGVMTASAAMNPEISRFFFDIGIPIYDCYGMTETSPAITMNCPSAYKIGSVGRAIPGVRVVIDKSVVEDGAQDGEIIAYGPNVMKGYHNKPEATAEVMTPDGGIRTGDRGRVDEDGFLFITGRIKEQYKLENGKFVFPASIEEDIRLITWVENAMIYGENKPFNVCLIVPDFLVLAKYAKEHNLPSDPKSLAENPQIQDMIRNEVISSLTGKYGGYEIPKKFIFLHENFTVENGTLTQTMKLKRRVVVNKYKDMIEKLYV
ncbi:MAG: AMP-dependent synthetase/ligase [Desulfomonilia bacterium]|jgi:long-chain acyl-CoA synthetase|uniref:Long-chain-fatty-acid--CoA ligase FadD15 n=1 Tax=anaerobic digester metagenome TaxID=1263854 RepID=A0A485LZ48_9ZZZZ|nr:long-chain fatty acid--CoA ligase [Pseudomonadota bacterium]HON39335.1 long-chain fatty acid--CoA ligase [Deltaproteobacteria bacterium]HRS57053.1 long-chain fatty acid--CoA ligase [Desulfomonilia bacterium]HPD22385.1 long-chain fatty acid--CoA ligase [Deltaproteobacteria bacterium]HPX17552.1 long-chain fatty acid--CoA ligase [Deltaproteobacteria bacterium]